MNGRVDPKSHAPPGRAEKVDPRPVHHRGHHRKTVVINTPANRPVDDDAGQIIVEGKLAVRFVRDDGFIIQIFGIDNATVKPIAPRWML